MPRVAIVGVVAIVAIASLADNANILSSFALPTSLYNAMVDRQTVYRKYRRSLV